MRPADDAPFPRRCRAAASGPRTAISRSRRKLRWRGVVTAVRRIDLADRRIAFRAGRYNAVIASASPALFAITTGRSLTVDARRVFGGSCP